MAETRNIASADLRRIAGNTVFVPAIRAVMLDAADQIDLLSSMVAERKEACEAWFAAHDSLFVEVERLKAENARLRKSLSAYIQSAPAGKFRLLSPNGSMRWFDTRGEAEIAIGLVPSNTTTDSGETSC